MKQLGMSMLVVLAITTTSLAVVTPASATTLETNGIKQSGEIELKASLSTGTSMIFKDTSGAFANTCKVWNFVGKDSTSKSGTTVSGPLSTLSFGNCTHEPWVTDANGGLSIEWIKGTTNGTVRSSGMKVTFPFTIFGSVVTGTCTTENTDLGTLTGAASGSATIDVNAVINCGSILPSAKWEAIWATTTSTGGSHAVGVAE